MRPKNNPKPEAPKNQETETLTFRLSKRLRSLAEVAARNKGVTLANHVETALEASLDQPIDFLRGASIAAVADELYDEDEALRILKRLKKYLWALRPEQKRLLNLIHTSPLFYPAFASTTPLSSPSTGPSSPRSQQAQPTPPSCLPNSLTASTSSSPR
jgi:hypothetical protein